MRCLFTLCAACCLSVLTGCVTPGAAAPAAQIVASIHTPPVTGDGWKTAALAEQRIDIAPIAEMIRQLRNGHHEGISSVLIARGGVLVLEEYFAGADRDSLHNTTSAAKSITSALLGIAIDQGFVGDVDRPILPYFPEYEGAIAEWDTRKRDITLAHVLSMSSGMACDEDAMYETDDWIKFYLDQPLVASPGERFSYNTCGIVALGDVITRASGLRIPAFADRYLFEPLGITEKFWPITNSLGSKGLAMTGGGLRLRPRDMAKFGQLYLNDGIWNGERLLSSTWIHESTRRHAKSDLHGEDYGYLWRIIDRTIAGRAIRSHEAWGNGGQFIMVFPGLDCVVVFTGENYGKFPQMELPFALVDQFILPALRGVADPARP
jgi:CubicO group peptidase (beta-lactamase class C family)